MATGAIQRRNQIANQIGHAVEAATTFELRKQLRALEKTMMQDRTTVSDAQKDQKILALVEDLYEQIKKGNEFLASNYISRISLLMTQRKILTDKRGDEKGMLDKLKNALRKKPKETLANAANKKIDESLFQLEIEAEIGSVKRTKALEDLRQIVASAVSLSPDSYEYRQARSRASAIKECIRLYEGQIDIAYKTLVDSQRYQQLIDNGLTIKKIKDLLPDPIEVDIVLEELTKTVEDVRETQMEFSSAVNVHARKMTTGASGDSIQDAEFDLAVASARESANLQGAEEAVFTEKAATEDKTSKAKDLDPISIQTEE